MTEAAEFASTGIPNLNLILGGGYTKGRTHLVVGLPGSGKTTVGLHFLIYGRDRGERTMFITLGDNAKELRAMADARGMSMHDVDIFELLPAGYWDPKLRQSVLHARDLELGEMMQAIMDAVIKSAPLRLVFSEFSEIRLLAQDPLLYRRQILILDRFFSEQHCTVLYLDNQLGDTDVSLQSVVHCVVKLEQIPAAYGAERRRMHVSKLRGRECRGGFHDFVIRDNGINVFPRLVAADYPAAKPAAVMASTGLSELDEALGGGIDRGTTTLIRGPSGAGKSALALQFLDVVLQRGEAALFISFDETQRNFELRAFQCSQTIRDGHQTGRLKFMRVDPAELSPGEMADIIRKEVLEGVRAVVLDSLSGYQNAMSAENSIFLHLHELFTFLNLQNVITTLVVAEGSGESSLDSPLYTTYLADTVLRLRFFEYDGRVRRALSVVKRRTGAHDGSIRELFFRSGCLYVGPALVDFTQVLSDIPVFVGDSSSLADLDLETV